MKKNIKKFYENSSWVCPAGVTHVVIIPETKKTKFFGLSLSAEPGGASYALSSNGNLYAWGVNSRGQLGDGVSVLSKSTPTLVVGGYKFQQIVAGQDSVLGCTSNGTCYAWGGNASGQLGDGVDVLSKSSPTLVVGGYKFKQIIASDENYSFFGLTADGTLYAWGNNDYGQLGDNTVAAKSSPTLVVGGRKFQQVASTGFSTMGLDYAGALYSWGNNSVGQLGVGNITSRSSPVSVLGSNIFKQFSLKGYSGNDSTLAVASDGTCYAWGFNSAGQLGTGNTTKYSSPTLVLGGNVFQQVISTSFGGNFSFGLTADGTLYAWGAGGAGQLGNGGITSRSVPVAVSGGFKFKQISACSGGSWPSAYGLTLDGELYAWGSNRYSTNVTGVLGDGTSILNRSTPTLVVGGYTFKQVLLTSALYGLGLATNGILYAWGFNVTATLAGCGQLGDGTILSRSSPTLITITRFVSHL